MKIKFFKIISVMVCFISLLSIGGCNAEKPNDNTVKPNDDPYRPKGLEITISDSNNNRLYNNASPQPEILSLDEEYFLTLNITIGAAFVSYENIYFKYDKDVVEIIPLTDQYDGEIYSLRGLKECSNSVIEYYNYKYYLDSNGNATTDYEIKSYCRILVSFS